MLLYALSNFEIQKYYQNELKFNSVYSRNNLHKIKDEVHVINLEFKSIGIHWIALCVNNINNNNNNNNNNILIALELNIF